MKQTGSIATLPEMSYSTRNGTPFAKTVGNGTAKPGAGADTRKVARDFEGMVVGLMVKAMRETVGKDTLTGGGRGEEVFQSYLDQEYAMAIAENGNLGLASLIEKQLALPDAGAAAGRTPGRTPDGTVHQRGITEVANENHQ